MEHLLAKVGEFHKEMTAELKSQIGALFPWVDVHQAKAKANHKEWVAALKARQKRMEVLMDVILQMMEACLEKTEANQEKVEINTEACLVEAAVETIGALRDRRLAVNAPRMAEETDPG
jgi:hypothetical protein